jgi:hypothetical protein
MSEATQPPVIALVRDLMFSSRITATARAAGVVVLVVRDVQKLPGQAGRLLIADLNLDGAVPAAEQWKAQQQRPVFGFVSHVDAETIAAARQAGLDQVMPRSQFVQILPELLKPD